MDELLAFAENDYVVNGIKIHNPTLKEIAKDIGEEKFWNMVLSITATRYDCRVYLWALGIDFDTIHWWEAVCRRVKDGVMPDCRAIMPQIDFRRFIPCIDKECGEMVLYEPIQKIKITENDFAEIQKYWRTTLNLSAKDIRNGNEHTRKWRLQYELDKAKRQAERGIVQEFHSYIQPYISALINTEGFKYNWHTVWELPINVFIDALRRIQMMKQSDNLNFGLYTGNISYKDIKHKEELDWLRKIKPIESKYN